MTPLKPEEIQAASEWFNSHYCQSECAHYNTICRALAFTLAANGEPTSEMRQGCLSVIDCNKLSIERRLQNINDCYQKMIAKIWEELRGMDAAV